MELEGCPFGEKRDVGFIGGVPGAEIAVLEAKIAPCLDGYLGTS